MLRSMLRLRRPAAVLLLMCCMMTMSLVSGASAGVLSGKATARAADPPFQVARETLAQLAGARPGDRVEVVLQSTLPAGTILRLETLAFCPVPYPGTPGPGYEQVACAVTGGMSDMPPNFYSDPNGRFEFTMTIPPEGANVFPPAGQREREVSCAPGRACSLAFTLLHLVPGGKAERVPFVDSLKFTPKAAGAVEGCKPPEGDRYVDALGPHRLTESEVGWVVDRCGSGARQDLDYTAMDDVEARDSFRGGEGDVFFGAGGVMAEGEKPKDAGRTPVPVPVALNAQVLAIAGKYPASSSTPSSPRPAPVTDVRLTAEQFADILARPITSIKDGPYAGGILAANPQIAAIQTNQRSRVSTLAYATPEVGHWLTSRFLSARGGTAWRYPDAPQYDRPGAPIGELWRLESLNPKDTAGLILAGDRVSLGKALTEPGVEGECLDARPKGCLNFVLTDAATAAALRLPVARIENAPGEFVAPTAQSMQAAAGGMKKRPDGDLVTDAAARNPGAYPLTFVEYAWAPAEAKVDGQCRPTAKQKAVNDVLSYLVANGQNKLSGGLAPLPSGLRKTAGDALRKVGSKAPRCPGGTPDGGGPGGGGTADPAAGGGLTGDAAGTAGAAGAGAGAAGDHPTRPVTAGGRQNALRVANDTKIPLFAGMAALVLIIPLGALVLTNALTSGTAYGSSGRAWPPWLVRALKATAAGAVWLRTRAGQAGQWAPRLRQRGKA